ncbi:hypothetical protein ASPZODRAFT_136280 [Penicilliopsis zonata CBS 506.65]|uniref:Protein CMS1 n=1 Tax=Penicilliopsis zonata CBS 506.65 TaxID=1073090 RepID=A0A1L9S8D0_9EURO|nr:hypothetical protein ASPZODRAFT_136280 [Penicilliopsis zonata CBS 506.65]OJJ43421.1 hypothetical protein ASPZODRAFT_136280 [Penicilliopsis zonata CBS 506.65]
MAEVPPVSGLSAKVEKKRKRQADESTKEESKATNDSKPTEGPSKKKQRRKKNKQASKEQDIKDEERKNGIDESIGKMDGRLLADHFAQKLKRHNKELTEVEISDLYIPDSAFLDTSSFEGARSMDKLPDFLKNFSPKGFDLSKAAEEKGSPHTLVIAAAALRAADLVRGLRAFQTKESIVGKLFAKHIKLEEAKQFLERARIGLGVGTPQRLSDLIDSGKLKLDHLERIVIDGSHIDQKQRGVFDMKETHLPLLQLLTRSELRDRYGAKQKRIQILVF